MCVSPSPTGNFAAFTTCLAARRTPFLSMVLLNINLHLQDQALAWLVMICYHSYTQGESQGDTGIQAPQTFWK